MTGQTARSGVGCPECDEPYDGALSGTVAEGVSDTIRTGSIGRVCIIGPDDDHDFTTVYFHPDQYLRSDSDRGVDREGDEQ